MITKLPRLYKKDSKGKIRVLDIEFEDNKFRAVSGLEDGKLVTAAWTVCTPKNIGKVNETTSIQQAELEAKAHHEKKLREHYTLDKEEASDGEGNYFKVMLAVKTSDVKDFPKFPYIADYKLDGMRFTMGKDKCCSRNGTSVPAASHLEALTKDFRDANPNVTLDGEIYNHDLKANFEHLMHLARSQSFTNEERIECNDMLQFHMYDISYDGDLENVNATIRKSLVSQTVTLLNHPSIKEVHNEIVNTKEELDAFEAKAIALGYEGVILRSPNEPYIHKRTKHLIKVKRFITEEFTILDIVEGEGNRSGMAGKVVVDVNGVTVKPGIRGSHEYCKSLLQFKDKFIGLQATIRHFGLTDEKSLRFPVCIDINRKE